MKLLPCCRHPLHSFRTGARAERQAARLLRKKGFRILARNVWVGKDEIDILAVEGGILVAIEVRSRKQGIVAADVSVNRAKEDRLRRALQKLRGRNGIPGALPQRFDLVLMAPRCEPVHIRSAF